MPTSRKYRGWRYAPLRFAVWVVAAIYLGRVFYNNSLYDVRRLTARHVFVRTLSIAIVLGFVYWNVFVVDPQIAVTVWTLVAVLLGKFVLVKQVIETRAESTGSPDRVQRRLHARRSDTDDARMAVIDDVRTGDTADD